MGFLHNKRDIDLPDWENDSPYVPFYPQFPSFVNSAFVGSDDIRVLHFALETRSINKHPQ